MTCQVETLSTSVAFLLGDTPAKTLSLFTGPDFCKSPLLPLPFTTHTTTSPLTLVQLSPLPPPSNPACPALPPVPSRSLVPPKYQFGPWNQFSNEFNNTGYFDAIKRFAELDIPS